MVQDIYGEKNWCCKSFLLCIKIFAYYEKITLFSYHFFLLSLIIIFLSVYLLSIIYNLTFFSYYFFLTYCLLLFSITFSNNLSIYLFILHNHISNMFCRKYYLIFVSINLGYCYKTCKVLYHSFILYYWKNLLFEWDQWFIS